MGSLSSPVEDGRDMNRSSFAMAGSLLMQTETGHVVLQEAAVQQVEFLEKEISFPTWTTDRTRLVMNLEKPAPGKTVTVNSLSSGISWLPTYRVELGAEGHAQLQCKATIMNELMDLEKVDMELISGFPRLAMPGAFSHLHEAEHERLVCRPGVRKTRNGIRPVPHGQLHEPGPHSAARIHHGEGHGH